MQVSKMERDRAIYCVEKWMMERGYEKRETYAVLKRKRKLEEVLKKAGGWVIRCSEILQYSYL